MKLKIGIIISALLAAAFSTAALLPSSDYETMNTGSKVVWFIMITPVVMLGAVGIYLTLFHTGVVKQALECERDK